MLLIGLVATALGSDFLVYGPTNGANSQISNALTEAGHTVTVWNETQWRSASIVAFGSFDAIVVGDPNCGGPERPTYDALFETRAAWSAVIKGNVVLTGTDAGCHFGAGRAKEFFVQGATWAASADRTGLFVSSDWGRATQTPTGTGAFGATFMTGLADIRTLSASGDRVVLSDAGATHPVFEGISSAQMSDWRTTYHAQWTQHATYPNDFTTLLTNADTNGNPGSLAVVVVRDECDWDGDGFDSNGDSCGGPDCDDRDPAISPAATEICDGIDNDCNEGVDEASAVGALRWYEDRDTDTWGNPLVSITACTKPNGYVNRAGDCRDDIATANPDGTEVPYDGIDNDCVGGDRCDVDGDGANQDGPNCRGLDCDDSNPAIKPTAVEIWYDGIDQNCDDHNDWDADFDGFESEAETLDGTDCNDVDPTVYPGAPELADGKDNDCNGYREDQDTDGDGVFDEDEITAGTDPESADSDGDGVPDWYEIGGDLFNPLDTDNDGIIDARDGDDDGDGIPTSVEIGDWDWGVPGTLPPDADEDELPNHLDRDSDADSFSDEEEGVVDTDEDGTPDFLDTDSDDDTVLDIDERPGNTDGDAFDDRVDPDDDDDGLPTAVEAAWTEQDADNDTVPNWLDDDSDSDGIRDEIELDGDQDGDGIPNFVDADDFDGPLMQPERILQGGGCGGANTAPGAPTGAGLAAALLLLARRRRR